MLKKEYMEESILKTSIRFLILAILLIGMAGIVSASCTERSSIQFAGVDNEGNLRLDLIVQDKDLDVMLIDDLGNVLAEFAPIGVGTWEEHRNIESTAGVLYAQLVKDGVIIDKRIVENCPNIIFIRRNTDKDSVTVKARCLLPTTDGSGYYINWIIWTPNTEARGCLFPVSGGSDAITAVLEEGEYFFVSIVGEEGTLLSKTVLLERVYYCNPLESGPLDFLTDKKVSELILKMV
jgi:hypothetical protein